MYFQLYVLAHSVTYRNLIFTKIIDFVLFGFLSKAQSEGSIPMSENEEFEVVELDQGDGWTRVRRLDHDEEGFVPTSYIECTLYNNC